MNKIAVEYMMNDGPRQNFIPKDDMLRVTLDLSDNGLVFCVLDDMMLRLSRKGAEEAKENKVRSPQLDLTQVHKGIERRLVEKDKEFASTRRTLLRS